ncbi:MAG: hypothetical protein LUQ59_07115 [Methanothrix sp.]|nr:hypothetical protein [Methanothrix sp.]
MSKSCRSLALAGMKSLHINIFWEHSSFFVMLFSDHVEYIEQLSLCLIRSSSLGMASRNSRYEDYECAVVFRAEDNGVIVKSFH